MFPGGPPQLTGVARASLEELLEDYRDFLRVRGHEPWARDSREARFVRRLGAQPDVTYTTYQTFLETRPAEVVAKIMVSLVCQTPYLLNLQLRSLQRAFLEDGGLRERMTAARLQRRRRNQIS